MVDEVVPASTGVAPVPDWFAAWPEPGSAAAVADPGGDWGLVGRGWGVSDIVWLSAKGGSRTLYAGSGCQPSAAERVRNRTATDAGTVDFSDQVGCRP